MPRARIGTALTMALACLSLGSNVDAVANLRSAVAALRVRFPALLVSPAYQTPAVGFDGADFINAAAVIDSDLDPYALEAWLHALEDAHGRDRSGPRFGDRALDVDIVLFDQCVIDGPGHLQVPRDELRHAFVLKPLVDIAPGVIEPRSGLRLDALWGAHPQHGAQFAVVALD